MVKRKNVMINERIHDKLKLDAVILKKPIRQIVEQLIIDWLNIDIEMRKKK